MVVCDGWDQIVPTRCHYRRDDRQASGTIWTSDNNANLQTFWIHESRNPVAAEAYLRIGLREKGRADGYLEIGLSDLSILGWMFGAVAAIELVWWLLWLDELDRRWHERNMKRLRKRK